MNCRIVCLVMACLALVSTGAAAQDVAGGRDHPLISRYAGAVLNSQQVEEYVELEIVRAEKPAPSTGRRYGERVGGRLTSTNYLAPAKRTALEVFRNYEKALAAGGFTVLFKCELAACVEDRDRRLTGQHGYSGDVIARRFLDNKWSKKAASVEWTDSPSYFLSAQLRRAAGDVYLALWVTPGYAGDDEAAVFQFVLEAKPADTGMVKVDAAALGKGLAGEGRIALYGIHFDTAQATVKPESKPQLEEMAKLLRQQPALRVFIVGHTDNQGGFDANMALSRRRAEAVVAVLVKDHKIDAKRLAAQGAANIAPVASNGSEAGRGRNRRVELVAQ